jgi:hypothetical protein
MPTAQRFARRCFHFPKRVTKFEVDFPTQVAFNEWLRQLVRTPNPPGPVDQQKLKREPDHSDPSRTYRRPVPKKVPGVQGQKANHQYQDNECSFLARKREKESDTRHEFDDARYDHNTYTLRKKTWHDRQIFPGNNKVSQAGCGHE